MLIGRQLEEIDQRPAESRGTDIRELVDLTREDPPRRGEEEHGGVSGSHEELPHLIFVLGCHAAAAAAAAVLGTVDGGWRSFDIPAA